MRDMLWNVVRSKVTEGEILPWWARWVWATLYPVDFFYWRVGQTTGYQPDRDVWLIKGVTYSGSALRRLAKAQGETYRITRIGETVVLEQVHCAVPPSPTFEGERNEPN